MQIFFLSGLGADKSVYQFLEHSFYDPVFIDWLPPGKNESLQEYALRLKHSCIPDDGIIVGLSFGGMLATEIAKRYPLTKSILISSAKTNEELPPVYKTGNIIPLHKWTPYRLQKWFMMRIKWMFGIRTRQAAEIYEKIICRSDPVFNTWAVEAILKWSNKTVPSNVVHIHGTDDLILPYKYVQSDFAVKGGGHLMVLEEADVISTLIRKIIIDDRVMVAT